MDRKWSETLARLAQKMFSMDIRPPDIERHDWYVGSDLHRPERLPHETQEMYKLRRRRSQREARAITRTPTQQPATNALDFARFWTGQRVGSPKPHRKHRVRRPA